MTKNNKGKEEIEVLDLEPIQQPEKKFKEKTSLWQKIKDNWYYLSTKQKTIIIIAAVTVLIAILSTILYLVLTKDNNKTVKKEVVIAKDNYRYEDGILYFVVNNKDIGSYKCKNKDEDLCYVAYENNDDSFDTEVIKKANSNNKLRSKIIANKYVFVYDNENKKGDNIILYDIKNQKDLDIYKSIKTYNHLNNMVFALNQDDKYGVLNLEKSKEAVIDFDYDYLGVIEDNNDNEKIVATEKGGSYLLDENGKKLTSTLVGDIKNYTDKYVKTVDATNKYTIFDYQGNKIEEGLNYVDLLDNYYLTVDNENKLKIMDYEKTKYLEDGIPLYNTDYVPIITKDKNNKETSKDYAYTYSLDGTNLTITVNNNGKEEVSNINLLEGLVSKNLPFISYYNGTLYFYSDEAKTTLINSYICNNKNDIKDPNGTLETCKLAFDTNEADNETEEKITPAKIVPIYNNRYVFISDGNIINLVDLVDEKVMGSYNSIDTSSDATQEKPYNLSTKEQFIIAKNRSNKYGLLKLNESSVISVYNFEYDKLEKLHQNILATKGNKTFLLDYNGNKITFEFDGKIRDFNGERVKVLKDKKYYVYDYAGNLIFEDSYKYVDLQDDYVGLVDDANHLSVTDYDGNMLIKAILKLSSTTYYHPKDGYVKAFSMRKENNKLIITCATSQDTKVEKAKDFIYDLNTKERVN